LSSFEDLPTPRSNNFRGFDFEIEPPKAVEGPKGPHLFRSSSEYAQPEEDYYYLTMSPVTPRAPRRPETAFKIPPIPESATPIHRPISTLTEVLVQLNTGEVALWTPRQVARWMYNAGFEPSIVEKFEENDISGAILVTLKFEDLRELDIPSFGKRHKLWNEIHNLRGSAPGSPAPPTEIECESEDEIPQKKSRKGSKKHKKPGFEDIISPLESVSIVGIEQLMPKPHRCAKGENCNRWRKQQRIIAAFHKEHPISPMGGSFLIAGNPGHPSTAEAIRPFSEVVPSVVASSDVLGPGTFPPFRRHLQEASLANIQSRDPQDNVKQFLNFQHMEVMYSVEEPATPPYEMFPALTPPTPASPAATPLHNLRSLPKLAIPGPTQGPARSASAMAFSPGPMDRVEALSPRLRNSPNTAAQLRTQTTSPLNPNVYRFGTPASEMDVPYTSINLGPPSRDASQSVPPNMNYRQPIVRSQSHSSRRPSFPVMPALEENVAMADNSTLGGSSLHSRNNSSSTSNTLFSPISRPAERNPLDANHSGWMKKRKTRMLRHEWHEHHFTLTGTRLAMHKDARSNDILEAIDVDDYAIACSSLGSSKLNAAFRAMNIKMGSKEKEKERDESAFSFQLIPAAIEKGQRLRKMQNTGGKGEKTHHFAVKSRDERIDWMRELMLAKALKQKGEGFEINLNGNMI
jgi:hypothetical protein